jgi:hypothetical protein
MVRMEDQLVTPNEFTGSSVAILSARLQRIMEHEPVKYGGGIT